MSEPINDTSVFTSEVFSIEIIIVNILMIKPPCLSSSILEINKIAMFWFLVWLNKTKIQKKAKLCYYSFIVYTKIEDIYVDIAKDVELRFDTPKYEIKKHYLKIKMKR